MTSTESLFPRATPPGDPARSKTRLLAWCGIALCAYGAIHLFGVFSRKEPFLRDFVQEWTSARNWQIGRPVYEDLREAVPFYFPGAQLAGLRFNAHPPVAVALAIPFGYLAYDQALLAWKVLSLICVLIAVFCLWIRRGLELSLGERLCVMGVVLSSSVLDSQLVQGQLNGILLLLVIGAWSYARHDQVVPAGILVGIAAAVKLFPGLLLFYFLARREWKGCVSVVASWMVVNAAAAILLGVDSVRDYMTVVIPDVSRFCDTWVNASLLGFLSRLFDGSFSQVTPILHAPALTKVMWLFLSLVLIARTLFVTSSGWKKINESAVPRPAKQVPNDQRDDSRLRSSDLSFSTWVCLMLLVSPVAWNHYFLLSVLPLVVLWHWRGRCSRPGEHYVLFLLVAVLLLIVVSPFTIWCVLVPGFARRGMCPEVAQPVMLVTGISYQFYLSLIVYSSCLQNCSAGSAESWVAARKVNSLVLQGES